MRLLLFLLLLIPAQLQAQLELIPSKIERKYTSSVVEVRAPATAKLLIDATNEKREPVAYMDLGNRLYEINSQEKVWFRVIAVDFESEFFDTQVVIVDPSGEPLPPIPPDNNDDDKPKPPPEDYNGPNQFGLGKLAYDQAPLLPEDYAKVIATYKAAGEYLYGRPEQKVMNAPVGDPRNGTDYEIPIWLRDQIPNTDWNTWHNAITNEYVRLNKEGKLTTRRQWYDAFNEIAAGLEARQ